MKALHLPNGITEELPPISLTEALVGFKEISPIIPINWGDYHGIIEVTYDTELVLEFAISSKDAPKLGGIANIFKPSRRRSYE